LILRKIIKTVVTRSYILNFKAINAVNSISNSAWAVPRSPLSLQHYPSPKLDFRGNIAKEGMGKRRERKEEG